MEMCHRRAPTRVSTQAGYRLYGSGVLQRQANSPARTPLSERKARGQALRESARSLVGELQQESAEKEYDQAEIEFERQVRYDSVRDSAHDDDDVYTAQQRRNEGSEP